MGKSNFNDGFKRDAVAQLSERGYPVAELSGRLGINQHSLYQWKKRFAQARWAAFLRAHNLEHSMSRHGNCHDNAVAESVFNLLKRERIRRRTYQTREEARQDAVRRHRKVLHPEKRKHGRNGILSPVEFERQGKLTRQSV